MILVLIGIIVWVKKTTPKIAFVNSSIVVEKYLGLIEVRGIIDAKSKEWSANLDTLEIRYNKSLEKLNSAKGVLSNSQVARLEANVSNSLRNYQVYKEDVEKRLTEETEKMTQGALNQINAYIETYSKENDIDIVIGVTLSGNVLYGAERIDITKEILTGLNQSYKQK